MTERLAFLRAIRANPADSLPRLVFADYLDERDDPWGELIRVQLELDPIREFLDPRTQPLLDREAQLLRDHRATWLGEFAQLDGPDHDLGPLFVGGVPERIVLSLDEFLAVGQSLLDAFPSIRELALSGVRNQGNKLAGCELIDRFETLEIADWPTPDDIQALTSSRYFGSQSVIRVWDVPSDGTEGFLDTVSPTRWRPRARVEVVQLFGGMVAELRGHDPVRTDIAVMRSLQRFFAEWGPGRLEVVRPYRKAFRLLAAPEQPFLTGTTRNKDTDERSHVLIAERQMVGYFTGEGAFRRAAWDAKRRDEWAAPLTDFHDGPILAREFRAPRCSLKLWPERDANLFLHPAQQPDWLTEDEWRDAGRHLKLWLARGNYLLVANAKQYIGDATGRLRLV